MRIIKMLNMIRDILLIKKLYQKRQCLISHPIRLDDVCFILIDLNVRMKSFPLLSIFRGALNNEVQAIHYERKHFQLYKAISTIVYYI